MPKHIYPLKPCPWCNHTPRFYMLFQAGKEPEKTWLPHIYCENFNCTVQPKAKYVPIRKKQKQAPDILKIKIERAISYWNENNPCVATEGIELDFIEISKQS